MIGLVALQEETPFSLLSHKNIVRRQPSASQGKSPQWGAELVGSLTLDFSAFKSVRNKVLLFKPPAV